MVFSVKSTSSVEDCKYENCTSFPLANTALASSSSQPRAILCISVGCKFISVGSEILLRASIASLPDFPSTIDALSGLSFKPSIITAYASDLLVVISSFVSSVFL